jgi:hypothetical protein
MLSDPATAVPPSALASSAGVPDTYTHVLVDGEEVDYAPLLA